MIVYVLVVIGLVVYFGYVGFFNFGMVVFMVIGGYGYVILVLIFGLFWWVGMFIGFLGGVFFVVIFGILMLWLCVDYFVIVIIVVGEIV